MNGEGRWNLVINEDITDIFKLSFLSFWVWSMFSWLITAQSPYWPDLFTLFHGSVSFRSSEEVGEKPRLGQYKPPKSLLGSSYNTLGFQMVVRGIFFDWTVQMLIGSWYWPRIISVRQDHVLHQVWFAGWLSAGGWQMRPSIPVH